MDFRRSPGRYTVWQLDENAGSFAPITGQLSQAEADGIAANKNRAAPTTIYFSVPVDQPPPFRMFRDAPTANTGPPDPTLGTRTTRRPLVRDMPAPVPLENGSRLGQVRRRFIEPPVGPGMTDAELRVVLRGLGLTQEDLAEAIPVQLRTVRRWLSGETEVPEWLSKWLEEFEDETDAVVGRLMAEMRAKVAAGEQPVIETYRSDEECRRDYPGKPAGWHQAVAYRVSNAVADVRVRYRGMPLRGVRLSAD